VCQCFVFYEHGCVELLSVLDRSDQGLQPYKQSVCQAGSVGETAKRLPKKQQPDSACHFLITHADRATIASSKNAADA
jgi:hypothetical protein